MMKALSLGLACIISFNHMRLGSSNAFRGRTNITAPHELVSVKEMQRSLGEEVNAALGFKTRGRIQSLEVALYPMYESLPKNEHGNLGHTTVRYALHRLFIERHGWFVKGLEPTQTIQNVSSPAGLLKDRAPAYIQDLFEERLGGVGFDLADTALMAATLEHLIHDEATYRLRSAFWAVEISPNDTIGVEKVDEVLDFFMMIYILGIDHSSVSLDKLGMYKSQVDTLYPGWRDTQLFVREVRQSSMSASESGGRLNFSAMIQIAEQIGERHASFQNKECMQLKDKLLQMEGTQAGRVPISKFYAAALNGSSSFSESVDYLRHLGALEETSVDNPSVIVSNYLLSPSNCIASSSFYAVCCINECEALLGYLEKKIAAPIASPHQILRLVEGFPVTFVAAPLSASLVQRLEDIAQHHDGKVHLHSRLFSQWMHHAYPRECPYPHLSGTTTPLTAEEWMEETGLDCTANDNEMKTYVEAEFNTNVTWSDLPWTSEEELIAANQDLLVAQAAEVAQRYRRMHMRQLMLGVLLVSFAYKGYQLFVEVASMPGGPLDPEWTHKSAAV